MGTDIRQDIATLDNIYDKFAKMSKDEAEKAIIQLCQPLFDAGAFGVVFKSFIPSFNDGDACEYTVIGPYLLSNVEKMDEDDEDDDFDYDEFSAWTIEYGAKQGNFDEKYGITSDNALPIASELNFLETALSFLESIVGKAFGVGMEVVISADGTVKTNYCQGW